MSSPGTTQPLTAERLLRAVLVGLGAGFLSGLFGVGGGILMVPALVMVMHLDQRLAHGTSLAAVVPIAVSSTLSYTLSGEVDWVVAAFLALGAIGGAVVGTKLLHTLPERVLGWTFTALLVVTALRLLLAAESAGMLVATEMSRVGIPWRVDVHRELLETLLGERFPGGAQPRRMAELADEVSRAFGDGVRVRPDLPNDIIRAFSRAGILLSSTRKMGAAAHRPSCGGAAAGL